ncbi:hypothetical protein G3O00_01780 [Burkholderia sp. Ac-20384]|uniref:STY1053 family phage-associated protein n=1 Tax=Burkholderia sp. Ac-20384 TaxID=2703902 RepID=UPI00197F2546|nr:hypothetical protein [Burkholderia sp. Ac-20384]MBN3822346.1 hypothetical protein [Burkholderia sp. Ac-20384]
MPKLHVHTAFTLRHDDGSTEKFAVGEHNFPKPVAAHWYVQHHTREPIEGDAAREDSADSGSAESEAQLKAAAEFLQGEKIALEARAADLDKRAAELDERNATLAERERAFDARVAEFEEAQRAVAQAAADTAQQSGGNQAKPQGGKRQS